MCDGDDDCAEHYGGAMAAGARLYDGGDEVEGILDGWQLRCLAFCLDVEGMMDARRWRPLDELRRWTIATLRCVMQRLLGLL